MTAAAGGRVYLAKDATLDGERVSGMYPDQKKFAEVANKMDPDGSLQTDLVRRLNLRGLS